MKCNKCASEMRRIDGGGNIFYWQCDKCGNTLGRPEPQKIEDILDELTEEPE